MAGPAGPGRGGLSSPTGTAAQVLAAARTIVLVDWPSRDVPESLARAGYAVFVKGGPGGSDFSEYRVQGGEVVARRTGEQPTGADLLSAYRPLRELPQLIDLLRGLGTAAVAAAATTVQAAGLAWVAGQPILTVLAGIGR